MPGKKIVYDLTKKGFAVPKPSELPILLRKLETERPKMIELHRHKTREYVQNEQTEIDNLAGETRFFRRLINWFVIVNHRRKISTFRKEDQRYATEINKNIIHIKSILASGEFAGAEAECLLISYLRTLPPPAIVFNDVLLQANRRIRYNGVSIRSAQIDHVVLTPAGVFVIETKRWSQHFVASGNFFSPFDQVSRASYLCYDLLRHKFGKTRVRSVIASFGHLPNRPGDSYIKVLHPENLVGYISYFQSSELPADRFARIRQYFYAEQIDG